MNARENSLDQQTVSALQIRTFFALRLKESVARQLANHADSLCTFDKKMEANWIDSDNYHLTLCFLGEIDIELIDTLEALTRQKLTGCESLNVHLTELGYYPVNPELSVVAAMTCQSDALMALHDLLVEVARESGLSYHERGFKPHISLGRLPAENAFACRISGLASTSIAWPMQ